MSQKAFIMQKDFHTNVEIKPQCSVYVAQTVIYLDVSKYGSKTAQNVIKLNDVWIQ